ncbi:GAF domain-containing protein [Halobacteriales archaeon Cl-PHB]
MRLEEGRDRPFGGDGFDPDGNGNRFHRRLSETVADADLDFSQKVDRLLELGCERFGLELGLFCRIRDGSVEVQQAIGDADGVEAGTTFELWQSYCRTVVEERRPVAIEDVDEADPSLTAARDLTGLAAYFGTPIELSGQLYGSLCFGSQTARREGFSEDERTFVELLSEWLSYELERQHREDQLAAVNELSRSLLEAETGEAVAEHVVETAPTLLDLPVTGVVTYDDATGRLEPAAATDRLSTLLSESALLDPCDGAVWQAFLGEDPLLEELGETGDDAVTDLAMVPLGGDGVFLTASTTPDGFGDAGLEFVETVGATVRAALDRADRERELQDRERTLAEKTTTLERLNRINGIIRNIDQALVGATTRSEVMAVVCEQLATVDGYELAWIGVPDQTATTVEPVEWAGTDDGYLEGITVRTDEGPTAEGPAGNAVRTRQPQVVDDVVKADSFRPWREAALARGFQSVIGLPLVHQERLYGVLTVYASRPGRFGDLERTVLDEMSNTIAYALNAVESKQALVSDRVTTLEFSVDDGLAVADLTRSTGGSVTLEDVVPRTDGGFRCFLRTRGIPLAAIRDACHRLPVTNSDLVSRQERDGEAVYLFEADLEPNSFPSTVLEYGGRPAAMTVDDGTVSLTVELGGDADVRGFVDAFQRAFPSADLTAQHTGTRTDRTPGEYRTELTADLTERQLEALQTAYRSGYFEQPRPRTASEIADRMDITQPTFTSHLRAAERHLCQQVFDGDG